MVFRICNLDIQIALSHTMIVADWSEATHPMMISEPIKLPRNVSAKLIHPVPLTSTWKEWIKDGYVLKYCKFGLGDRNRLKILLRSYTIKT